MLRLLLAWLHLLALAVGLAGVWSRARALRGSVSAPEDASALRRAYNGDAWWGIAALVWLVTGLARLLAGTEKTTSYYMDNHAFYAKMGLFVLILLLEIWPMRTLIRWRSGTSHPNPRDAGRIEMISYLQCALVIAMVFFAASMARGYGFSSSTKVSPYSPLANAGIPAGSDAPTSLPGVSDADDPLPMQPSGTEVVSPDDIVLLTREITMPLAGVSPSSLHSNFAERRGGGSRAHEALDIMAPRRTIVMSAAAGRVLKLFTSKAGGLMVYAADSSERFVLMYAHLDGYAPGLREGTALSKGQPIGFVGSTGNAAANAPHLHFAIARSADVKRWSKGKPIDPLPVLRGAMFGAR